MNEQYKWKVSEEDIESMSTEEKRDYAAALLNRATLILRDVFDQAGRRYAQQHGISLD